MKIVTDQTSRQSTSVINLNVISTKKPDSVTAVDQLKGDLKIFPEELSNSIRHKKDADPLQAEMEDYIMELRGDGCSVVKERQREVGFDDPLKMCPREIRADMDNNVQSSAGIELEHLVSRGCSIKADGSAVKDICIDEGVPANDKILVEDIADGHKYIDEDSSSAKYTNYGSGNVKVDTEWLLPVCLISITDEETEKDLNSCESKVLVHQSESESETTGLVSSDRQKDKIIDTVFAEDTCVEECLLETSMENGYNDKQYILRPESAAEFEDATDKLICSSPTPESTIKDTVHDITVETSEMKVDPGQEATNNPSLPTAACNNEVELPSDGFLPQMAYTSLMPEQQNLAPDYITASAQIQRDHFESSFASVGPYTGSLSHRSDASTASTRSFAFPVLQNEWNFSPVRMRKADHRQLGRRRGWMNGLFCCKF